MGSEAPCGGGSHSTTLKSQNYAIFHNFKHPPSWKKNDAKILKEVIEPRKFIYLFLEICFLIIIQWFSFC